LRRFPPTNQTVGGSLPVGYTRIERVAYFDAPMSEYEDVDEAGPYDLPLSML
jgi:hypothetical protein